MAALTLLLPFLSLLLPPTLSTSRHTALHHPINPIKTGFQATLKHVDSDGNFTRFELLQRAIKRARKRIERVHAKTSNVDIQAPIHSGYGEYLMDLSIGTPPLSYAAILDTGSDLTWTQCQPCRHCFDQPTPIFDPKNSSTFSKVDCSSKLCTESGVAICNQGNCDYFYAYADGSYTYGLLASETFTFEDVPVPDIVFGCGFDNALNFNGSAGIAGLGRGTLSLVSQLQEPKFSYCLPAFGYASATGKLLMGSQANSSHGNVRITTPLIQNPSEPTLYYLSLQGISVGETLIPIKNPIEPDGSGNTIIDSGTTLTYLNDSAFEQVKDEFSRQINLTPVSGEELGLEVCFSLPSGVESVVVPKVVFHFEGSADLELPEENYFLSNASSNTGCLMMDGSPGISVFGNFQQQNMLVIHDLAEETISFETGYVCDDDTL
ncbi:UNVERIFIED_CONTAM: Aspartic proteinase nepenthesin-1 [Sesamum latifolium]|uniref:nepenthesin n=1 Tax=Sesamum latifolium TaxID=2727402 RepID=A0AAW2X7P1_9LAMI